MPPVFYHHKRFLDAASGESDDWAKGQAGIKFSYCFELRPDYAVSWDGFLLGEKEVSVVDGYSRVTVTTVDRFYLYFRLFPFIFTIFCFLKNRENNYYPKKSLKITIFPKFSTFD